MGHFSKDAINYFESTYHYPQQKYVRKDDTFDFVIASRGDRNHWAVWQRANKGGMPYIEIKSACADFVIRCGFRNIRTQQDDFRHVVSETIYDNDMWDRNFRWKKKYENVLMDILQEQKNISSAPCPYRLACWYQRRLENKVAEHYHSTINGEVTMLPPVVEHRNPLYVFISCFFGDEYEQYTMEQRIELIEKHIERCEKLKTVEPNSYINYLLSSPADKWPDHLEK